jgi:hypothetical protein
MVAPALNAEKNVFSVWALLADKRPLDHSGVSDLLKGQLIDFSKFT